MRIANTTKASSIRECLETKLRISVHVAGNGTFGVPLLANRPMPDMPDDRTRVQSSHDEGSLSQVS